MKLYYRQLSATSRLVQSGTSHALYFLRDGETKLGKNTMRLWLSLNSNGTVAARKMISSPAYRTMSGDFPCQTESTKAQDFFTQWRTQQGRGSTA